MTAPPPDRWYRVSVKALIFNTDRTKFLLIREKDGDWEMPGADLITAKVYTRPYKERFKKRWD